MAATRGIKAVARPESFEADVLSPDTFAVSQAKSLWGLANGPLGGGSIEECGPKPAAMRDLDFLAAEYH